MERGVSSEHVAAVVAIGDRVLRNYWVTQTYADLSAGLAALLGTDTTNWCTFATWASCTVGRNIRGEDLPEWLRRRIVLDDGLMGVAKQSSDDLHAGGWLEPWRRILPVHCSELVRELFGQSALALSDGNTLVFGEIAPPAAVFLAEFGAPDHDPAAARTRVLDACDGATAFDGRNRLAAGYAHWCDAMAETGRTTRAQRILAGSLELGDHEQHHLQAAITASMEFGVEEVLDRLATRLAHHEPLLAAPGRGVLGALRPVGERTQALWCTLMTELLGTIVTPEGTLRFDEDVPPIPGVAFTPPDLDPVAVPDLATLLTTFDRADADGRGSKADDWDSLADRMNFIANLFVSRLHRAELFGPPFDDAVVAELVADRIPGHPVGGSPALRRGGRRPIPAPPASVGTARFTDAFVEHLRWTGDEPADAAVAEYFRATGEPHDSLYHRIVRTAPGTLAGPDGGLPGIGMFARHVEPWPAWADPELVRAGQDVFGEYGPQLGMGLFMASLPSDYGFPTGVQALWRTSQLTDDPKRRYVETGQMIVDVMTPGALDPGNTGERVVRHVRLMHAAVRHVLSHLDQITLPPGVQVAPWREEFGLPISQLQLLGTLFSFGVMGVESLGRVGVRLTDEQAEAYIHVWNLVGHQIGIVDELLPLSWDDARTLWDERRAKEYGPTPEGKALTAAAIDAMHELFGLPGLGGVPATGIRHYLGDTDARGLGVPDADWTKVLFEAMRLGDPLYRKFLRHLPLTDALATRMGRQIWRGFEAYGRGSDRPDFAVSTELKRAWGM